MQNSKLSVSAFTFPYYTCFMNYRNITEIYCRHFRGTVYCMVLYIYRVTAETSNFPYFPEDR
jgi:hypothetical protein